MNTAIDSYSTIFTLAATANATAYNIAYVDAANNMPDPTVGSVNGTEVPLSSNIPTKPGYRFLGWCNTYTNNSNCSGTLYQPGDAYGLNQLTSNATKLYAVWQKIDNMTMQNVATWANTLGVGDTITVPDIRDGRAYMVGKLADGNIWMMDNLAFADTNVTLTPANTDIKEGVSRDWTKIPPNSVTNWQDSYNIAYIAYGNNNLNGTRVPGDELSQAGGWKVGAYYNYCAASAGTYCYTSGEHGDAQSSICPAGWRLPTGGANGEYKALYDIPEYGSQLRKILRLPTSGCYSNGSSTLVGSMGNFWTSTFNSTNSMNRLLFSGTSTISPNNSLNRNYGMAIRCVAKKSLQDVSSWGSKLAIGDTTIAIDARDGKEYNVGKMADNQIWLLDNLNFVDTNVELDRFNTDITANAARTWTKLPNGPTTEWAYSNTIPYVSWGNNNNKSLEGNYEERDGRKVGAYYNYCAASAGTICTENNSSDATSSICPAGWRLPIVTSSYDYEFGNLYAIINNISIEDISYVATSAMTRAFNDALRLPYPGVITHHQNGLYNFGSQTYIWSSIRDRNQMKVFYDTQYGITAYTSDRVNGLTIRCIAK